MQRRHHTLLCALSICNFLFHSRTFILWIIFHSTHMIYGFYEHFYACMFLYIIHWLLSILLHTYFIQRNSFFSYKKIS
jgi:hypothetical protein